MINKPMFEAVVKKERVHCNFSSGVSTQQLWLYFLTFVKGQPEYFKPFSVFSNCKCLLTKNIRNYTTHNLAFGVMKSFFTKRLVLYFIVRNPFAKGIFFNFDVFILWEELLCNSWFFTRNRLWRFLCKFLFQQNFFSCILINSHNFSAKALNLCFKHVLFQNASVNIL